MKKIVFEHLLAEEKNQFQISRRIPGWKEQQEWQNIPYTTCCSRRPRWSSSITYFLSLLFLDDWNEALKHNELKLLYRISSIADVQTIDLVELYMILFNNYLIDSF